MRRRRAPSGCLAALLGLLLGPTACGEPAEGADAGATDPPDAATDGGPADAGPLDETPPELRDVRAALADPPVTFDLSAGSQTRRIFTPTTVELRVFARDDVTPAEALSVRLVDPADGTTHAAAERVFERGLWKLTHAAEPGLAFAVVVADEAGNETELASTLSFPSLTDALARTWTALEYDASRTLVAQVEQRWADGALCHVEAGGRGGTYRVEAGDTLVVEERHTAACAEDPGAEADTVERTVQSRFFVDEVYLAPSRFERDGDGTGVAGTWTRAHAVTEGGATTSVTETLTLSGDGGFAWAREAGGTASSASGTWEVTDNLDYTFDYGDFLVLTVEARDGAALGTPETEVRSFVLREGYLLLDPLVDLEG